MRRWLTLREFDIIRDMQETMRRPGGSRQQAKERSNNQGPTIEKGKIDQMMVKLARLGGIAFLAGSVLKIIAEAAK